MADTDNRPLPDSDFKRFAEGVAIVAMHTLVDGHVAAEHDEVFIGTLHVYDAMSDAWRAVMEALGWHWRERDRCWRRNT